MHFSVKFKQFVERKKLAKNGEKIKHIIHDSNGVKKMAKKILKKFKRKKASKFKESQKSWVKISKKKVTWKLKKIRAIFKIHLKKMA